MGGSMTNTDHIDPGHGTPAPEHSAEVHPLSAEGVEPDRPAMRNLVIIIGVLSVFVIGSGIALYYFLEFSAKAEYSKKAAPNPELVEQIEKDRVRTQTAGAEPGLTEKDPPIPHRPVAEAVQEILQNPGLLKHGPPPPAPIKGAAPPPGAPAPAPGGAIK